MCWMVAGIVLGACTALEQAAPGKDGRLPLVPPARPSQRVLLETGAAPLGSGMMPNYCSGRRDARQHVTCVRLNICMGWGQSHASKADG